LVLAQDQRTFLEIIQRGLNFCQIPLVLRVLITQALEKAVAGADRIGRLVDEAPGAVKKILRGQGVGPGVNEEKQVFTGYCRKDALAVDGFPSLTGAPRAIYRAN
jgi:hypothetical protein